MTTLFRRIFRIREKGSTRSRHLREKRVAAKSTFLLKSRRLTLLILLCSTILISFVSFWGQAPSGPRISVDQLARVQVNAETSFSYVSRIRTELKRDLQRKQVAPVYAVSYERFSEFEVFINELNDLLLEFSRTHRELSPNEQERKLEETLHTTITNSTFSVDVSSVLTLYRETDFRERYRLLQQGLTELWHIYREGIFSPGSQAANRSGRYSLIKITDEEGRTREVQFKSPTEALLDLRVRLSRLENLEVIYQSLFEIMKEGIVVNLFYDEAAHAREINAAVNQVQPVEVSIRRGDTIIELGSIVTPLDMEKLNAYEERRRQEAKTTPLMGDFMQERIFYVIILLGVTVIFVFTAFPPTDQTNSHYLLCALMITINVIAIRMVLELGETSLFADTKTLGSLLLYAPPFLIAPLVINLLLGVLPAVLSALIISSIYGLMQGESIETFLVVLLTCMVGITLSHKVRVRSKIVRASFLAGLVLALTIVVQGYFDQEGMTVVLQRSLLSLMLSLVYGMLIVGIVPILEASFKISSDITLLELTDFNHPLLRKMQMEAPGTYHHSLMVANISEKAAIEVGANPLVCRTCSFFHDIGKLSKPEYFTENQLAGSPNPHDSMKPSMSALIIKNHVSEGVQMARRYSLPKIIIDIIRQHHGTSLIRYFYFQALNEAKERAKKEGGSQPTHVTIDQSNYRYDGPTPQFKEAAIIFLADSVEAASRSLKKVTQQNIEDLIDSIIANAIADNQLDQAPLSYQELAKIRSSFIMSILNMLHSRIEYPKADDGKLTTSGKPALKSTDPADAPIEKNSSHASHGN